MNQDLEAHMQAIVEKLDPQFRALGQRDVDVLVKAQVKSFDDLSTILQDQTADIELRSAACWVLARLSDKRSVPILLTLLTDSHPELRATAARSLGELGGSEPVDALVATLYDDRQDEVRQAAAYALGLIGDLKAVEPLVNVLSDPSQSPRVRGATAEALADLKDGRAVAPLIAALKDESAEVRFWAAFTLGELRDPQALPELRRLADTDDSVLPGRGTIKEEASVAIAQIHARGSTNAHFSSQ